MTISPRFFSIILCIGIFLSTYSFASAEAKTTRNKVEENLKNDKIVIRITDEGLVYLNDKEVALNFLAEKIIELQQTLATDSPDAYTATIIVMEGASQELIDKVKKQIKKTKINIINLQKKREIAQETSVISETKIAVYDSLVRSWKSMPESERNLKAKDLNLVEFIYNNMSFEQRINAEKLPDFLPFVTETVFQKDITKQLLDKWSFSNNYQIIIDDVKVKNDTLKTISPVLFKRYYETNLEKDTIPEFQINLYTKSYYRQD